MPKVTGDAAKQLLQSQFDQHSSGILATLAPLDAASTVDGWMQTLRAIEEFINLPLDLDDDIVVEAFGELSLEPASVNPRRWNFILHHVTYQYGSAFAARLGLLMTQLSAMQGGFALHGVAPAAVGLRCVKMAVGYLQSRRRHLLTLLYLMPSACSGTRKLVAWDTLNVFLPQVEISGTTLTGLVQNLMMVELHPEFALLVDAHGFSTTHTYPALDGMFLEAERVSIVDLAQGTTRPTDTEVVPAGEVFSAEELRNDIRWMESAYSEFYLKDSEFGPPARLVEELSLRAEDHFWVSVTEVELARMASAHQVTKEVLDRMVFRGASYLDAVNDYAAFVLVGGRLRTTVSLLSRFLYNWKNVCLYSNRRFQIRTGFLFEKRVRQELAEQGFELTDIKRLNKKEFDVVAIRDGVIFNVQCKNNLVDPTWIDLDPPRFLRTNRTLAKLYDRALAKERSREQLLRDELKLERVEPFVVTRFPVMSSNPRVLPLSQIGQFGKVARALLQASPGGVAVGA